MKFPPYESADDYVSTLMNMVPASTEGLLACITALRAHGVDWYRFKYMLQNRFGTDHVGRVRNKNLLDAYITTGIHDAEVLIQDTFGFGNRIYLDEEFWKHLPSVEECSYIDGLPRWNEGRAYRALSETGILANTDILLRIPNEDYQERIEFLDCLREVPDFHSHEFGVKSVTLEVNTLKALKAIPKAVAAIEEGIRIFIKFGDLPMTHFKEVEAIDRPLLCFIPYQWGKKPKMPWNLVKAWRYATHPNPEKKLFFQEVWKIALHQSKEQEL